MMTEKKLTDRIIFMGSPDFGIPTLSKLHQKYPNNLVGIFTQPDRPKRRSKKPIPTPVKTWGLENNIPVFQTDQNSDLTTQITLLQPTLIIVIAYGLLLPKNITDHFNCINIHGSLLPKHRGATPIQASILAGDKITGITLIRMTKGLDEGPILAAETTTLSEDTTFGALFKKLQHLSTNCLLKFLDTATQKNMKGLPQNHALATYCHKINKADLQLDWTEEPHTLLRKIKAFSPIPGTYTITQKKQRIKILDAKIEKGQLIPLIVKPEGKQEMTYIDFCRGNKGDLSC